MLQSNVRNLSRLLHPWMRITLTFASNHLKPCIFTFNGVQKFIARSFTKEHYIHCVSHLPKQNETPLCSSMVKQSSLFGEQQQQDYLESRMVAFVRTLGVSTHQHCLCYEALFSCCVRLKSPTCSRSHLQLLVNMLCLSFSIF